MTLQDYLRREIAASNVEWHDKHIHPCFGESHQTWTLALHLPVPLDATDKSPEAALERFFTQVRAL